MLNSNPSRSRGFTKGSRPFFTPRGSKIAPMCLLHILPSLASQKLNYKYIRVCGIQIIHISGFFIRINHFFTPRGFRKSPRRFFLAIFRKFWLKIWLQVHYDMPNWNLTRFQGFSWGVPLFSPPGHYGSELGDFETFGKNRFLSQGPGTFSWPWWVSWAYGMEH